MDESTVEPKPAEVVSDTMHEPHPHASKRVILGISATVVVFILGGIIWSRWGERIEEVCFGKDDSCSAAQGGEFIEGSLQYDTEAFGANN